MKPPQPSRQPGPKQPHAAMTHEPPASLRALRRGMTVFLIAAGLSILYVVAWFALASAFRDNAESWITARRAEGYVIGFSGFRLGGFPLALRLDLDRPEIAPPGAPGAWAWKGGKLIVKQWPWAPGRIVLRALGPHRLVAEFPQGRTELKGRARKIEVQLALDGAWPARAGLDITGLDMAGNGGARLALDRGSVRFQRLGDADADYRTPTMDLTITADSAILPPGFPLPLGRLVERLRLKGVVLGRVPEGRPGEALAGWRDQGGAVDLRELDVAYGPLALSASGTLALDADMQPIGALTAKVRGFFQTVDRLRQAGLIEARSAVTAKLVLGVLVKKPSGGGVPSLNLALTVQNRKLYAGPVPLAQIPEIRWP